MSTNPSIHFTLVGSNIHDSFLDALKSKPEDYAYTAVSSFAEYKPPAGTEAHVIVLHGHDDELAKTTTVAQLLDQPIILAFFAPSKDVLDALQDASKSLVHIPSIELEDGAPIIIHRRPDDGVISLMPGFTAPTESIPVTEDVVVAGEETSDSMPAPFIPTAAPTPEENPTTNYAKSVNTIQLAVEYHLELLHRDGTQALADGDHLRPPQGIQFYKAIDLSTTFNSIPNTYSYEKQRFKYVYRVRVHAYCTNAKPTDQDFEKNGGEVHVVAVLRGEVFRDPSGKPRMYDPRALMYWFLDAATFQARPRPGESALTPVKGEPQSSQTNGLDTTYTIDFSTTLSMSKAGRWVAFDASYGESFTRNEFKQKVQSQEGGFDMLIYYNNYYDKSLGSVPYEGAKGWENVYGNKGLIKSFPEDYIPLHALFHWTTSKLRSHTIDISGYLTYVLFYYMRIRNLGSSSHEQSHTLDLSANNWH